MVTGVRDSKTFCSSYFTHHSIDLDWFWYTVETCLCDEPHTHFISSHQCSRERTYSISLEQQFLTFAVIRYFRPIFITLMLVETRKLYILITVWMTLTFIQGHNCIKIKNSCVHSIGILQSIFMLFNMLPQPVGLWSWWYFFKNK